MEKGTIFNIEKTSDQIRDTVLTNTIKMITRRKYIKDDKQKQESIDKIVKPNNPEHEDSKYIIHIDNYEGDANIKKIIVKIIPYKITSIGKPYGIRDFLDVEPNVPKILIVEEVSKRALMTLTAFKNVEMLEEKFLMSDLMEQVMIPPHIKLTDAVKNEVIKIYNTPKTNFPRMLITDPISIYFKAKIGDMFLIRRPSSRTGYTIAFRIVNNVPVK